MPSRMSTPAHDPRASRLGAAGECLLDEIERRFRLLCAGPQPLAVDGAQVGHGLPRRLIPLPELSAILMHPSCGFAARDAAWRLLVTRARTGDAGWTVGAVGVALPGLRRAANRLARSFCGDAQAALVTEFVAALGRVDIAQTGVVSRLVDAAQTAARIALRATEPAASGEANFAPSSTLPPAPYGHPDLVLARAVAAGVLSVQEADLIGTTYLEDVSVAEYADRTGQSRWAVYKRRKAAETRLVEAIRSGALTDPDADVITEATLTTAPDPDAYDRF
jgi:hypothetical protein